ncbi:hypothetical protein BD289DRAFT_487123 [Coniella lustricola]|uniref:Autophagy-related protein 29 n=1 Tax=Coniella lustricola TaxID=2025994 RepID=A0A2T2ZST5_9PEZI|nr:hypothetical protein BD289DRAFT_487123 [Coniella lustricola]
MDSEPTYVVYVRLPFPRGDFKDPPPVNWDSYKDEALWKIISGVAKTEIDWTDLAARFEVSVDFLFQQVTYLQERHTSQLRAQLRKATVAARSSAAPSPAPGSESASAMARTFSGQGVSGHPRAPSQLSIRKDTPVSRSAESGASTPSAGPDSSSRPQNPRASSSSTTGIAAGPSRLRAGSKLSSPRVQTARQWLPARPGETPSTPVAVAPTPIHAGEPPGSPGPADSASESSSSDDSSSPAQSRIIRRPRFQQQPHGERDGSMSNFLSYLGEDEAEPAFLPFRTTPSGAPNEMSGKRSGQYTDPSATLKGDPRDFTANAARRLQNVTGGDGSHSKGKGKEQERALNQSGTSDSSNSSAAFASKPSFGDQRLPSGPLSPRRTTELKSRGYSREGSDGTPSMGSSFSDLDDASVTQSALEEALASKMQGGGTIGSTISNVFRSRYLPK